MIISRSALKTNYLYCFHSADYFSANISPVFLEDGREYGRCGIKWLICKKQKNSVVINFFERMYFYEKDFIGSIYGGNLHNNIGNADMRSQK